MTLQPPEASCLKSWTLTYSNPDTILAFRQARLHIVPRTLKPQAFDQRMEIIDNINHLLGENLKRTIKSNAKLKIAVSCFSIYAYAAMKISWFLNKY